MPSCPDSSPIAPPTDFLGQGGAIATLLRERDWRDSPLGAPSTWSPSLKTLMATILPAQAQIVLFWGAQYVALYNDAYSPTIGAKHPQALGRPGIEHWRELWDDLEPLLRGVRETGQTYSAKDRAFYIERSGHGETVYFDISYSAVREADGSIGGVLCIVTETTERVYFEQRQAFLLELTLRLRGLSEVEEIERLVVRRLADQLNADRVLYASDRGDGMHFEVLREYSPSLPPLAAQRRYADVDPQLARHLRKGLTITGNALYVPIQRFDRLVAFIAVQYSAAHRFSSHETLLAEETARLTWLSLNHARAEAELRDLNATLKERVVSIVAERETAIAQLHEARKMEMVGQLTGGLAHDFNNLLTPIMASLELIQRKVDDERSTRLIDGALQAAERARVLVGRLLTFARRQALKPQAVPLHELLANVRDLAVHSLGRGIDLQIEVAEALPAIMVDPHQLELAILNLAVNARDAMPDGGRLRFTAVFDDGTQGRPSSVPPGPFVCLSVTDTGSGMPAEVLAHCVDPFFTTKGVGKGTGLGLSMVQGLAVQSGGGFEVSSAPQQGTRVSLWLPLAEGPVLPRRADDGVTHQAPRHTRVLLVDDEELVRQTTALQLRDLGYEVSDWASAALALEAVEGGLVPDILVTDYVMAHMNGAQLATELRQRWPGLPVLIVTGYTDLNAEQLSRFEVLNKPYRRVELAEHLIRLLPGGAKQAK